MAAASKPLRRPGEPARVMELNLAELTRAELVARQRNRGELTQRYGAALSSNEGNSRAIHVLGAQAEIAVGKALGVPAPLGVDVFRKVANIPPHWSVRAIFENSKNQDLRLRPRDWHAGWRHVLVERAALIHGDPVFIVHGWIADEDARSAGRMGFGDRDNRFISPRYLRELEYEGPQGEHLSYLEDVAERYEGVDLGGSWIRQASA